MIDTGMSVMLVHGDNVSDALKPEVYYDYMLSEQDYNAV